MKFREKIHQLTGLTGLEFFGISLGVIAFVLALIAIIYNYNKINQDNHD